MISLKKIFQPKPPAVDLRKTKNFSWLPNYEVYELVNGCTIDSLIDHGRIVHIKGFCGNKCYYRIDAEYCVVHEGPDKKPYNLTLISDWQLKEMCEKKGADKKIADLKLRVLYTQGDYTDERRVIRELQIKAEEHYAQVLKSLEAGKER